MPAPGYGGLFYIRLRRWSYLLRLFGRLKPYSVDFALSENDVIYILLIQDCVFNMSSLFDLVRLMTAIEQSGHRTVLLRFGTYSCH